MKAIRLLIVVVALSIIAYYSYLRFSQDSEATIKQTLMDAALVYQGRCKLDSAAASHAVGQLMADEMRVHFDEAAYFKRIQALEMARAGHRSLGNLLTALPLFLEEQFGVNPMQLAATKASRAALEKARADDSCPAVEQPEQAPEVTTQPAAAASEQAVTGPASLGEQWKNYGGDASKFVAHCVADALKGASPADQAALSAVHEEKCKADHTFLVDCIEKKARPTSECVSEVENQGD